MKFKLTQLSDIRKMVPTFFDALKGRKMIAFHGEMGVGKTTFISELLKYMGVEDSVSSPTFSIVNEYHSNSFGKIYHFDFYRINDAYEALDIGVEEIFEEDAYCFMEWPQKIDNLIPSDCVLVHIELDNDARIVNLEI